MTAPLDPAARLVEADRSAALAREKLSSTTAELQARLEPARLADVALTEVKAAGTASAAAAQRHRGALVGVGAAIGLFLARRPLIRLLRRRRGETPPDAPR